MAIDLATGFNIGSKDAIDERQVLTLEQMKNLDESIYPDKYFAICKDNGKLYLYDASNEINDETGKFRVLEGSGTSDLTGYKKTYTSTSELFVDSYPTSIKDIIEKLEHGETFLGNASEYDYSWFPIRISAMFRIIKGKKENLSDTTVEWFSSRTGDYAIAVLSQSAGVERWILIREDGKRDYIDSYPIRKWNLLAKISLSSSDITKHILSFSCLNQVSGTSDGYYYFGKDADLCKYELHFTTPGSSGNLTKYGLVLYEYPMPEGTADGLKNLSKNIGLYYDEDNLHIYIFIINTTDVNYLEGRYIGNGLANCILEYTGEGTIVQSYNRSGSDLITWDDVYGDVCAFEDLEFPTVVPIGGDGGTVDLSGYAKTYTSLADLELTSSATINEVISKLSPGDVFTCSVTSFSNYQTMFPYSDSYDSDAFVFIHRGRTPVMSYAKWYKRDGSSEALAYFNGLTGYIEDWNTFSTRKTYISLTDLKLTADATITQVVNSMLEGESFRSIVTKFNNYQTMFPYEEEEDQNAYVLIDKLNGNAVYAAWYRIDGTKHYIGNYTNNTLQNWVNYSPTSDLSEGTKTYTSLTELGLTADAAFQDVVDKLPKGGSALLGVKEFTNYQTIFPYEEGNDQFSRVHVVKGVADGSGMYARWFRKDGVKEAIAIFNINDNTFSGWRILKDQRVYTSLSELGLTSDATVEDVVNTLKNGESFLAPVNTFTNYETIFPNKVPNDQWNKIHIIKGTSLASSHIRCFSPSGTFEYLANINNTNIVTWNDVSGTYTDISDAVIGKLGTEILKYPVGKYRINSTATGNKFTDLPSDAEIKCGIIEVNGTAVGKSPFTDTWVYRMYKFECLTGTLSYVRRLNSGATAGQIELDTGWQRVITENSKTDPYSCTRYTVLTGTEDLFTLPCGHYASTIADTAYNYPVTDSNKVTAHIYVLGCLNDPANNKGYRIILYFDNKDRMYRINEWWGNFSNGWKEISVETESKKEEDSYIPDMYDRNANGDIPVVPFDRLANCIAVRTNRGLVSTTETEETYDEDYVGGYVFAGANDVLIKDKEMFNKIKVLVHIPGVLRIGIVNEKIYEANPRYSTCLVKWLVADFVAFTGMKEYDISDTVLEEGQSIFLECRTGVSSWYLNTGEATQVGAVTYPASSCTTGLNVADTLDTTTNNALFKSQKVNSSSCLTSFGNNMYSIGGNIRCNFQERAYNNGATSSKETYENTEYFGGLNIGLYRRTKYSDTRLGKCVENLMNTSFTGNDTARRAYAPAHQESLVGKSVYAFKIDVHTPGNLTIYHVKGKTVDTFEIIDKYTHYVRAKGLQTIHLPFDIKLQSEDEYIAFGGIHCKSTSDNIVFSECKWLYGVVPNWMKMGHNNGYIHLNFDPTSYPEAIIEIGDYSNNTNTLNIELICRGKKRSPLEDKYISFTGDSITTFAGFCTTQAGYPEGNPAGDNAVYYPASGKVVNNVDATWWGILARDNRMKILRNDAWSGSRVSSTEGSTDTKCLCGTQRRYNLRNGYAYATNSTYPFGRPEIIVSMIGTNDLSGGVELGQEMFKGVTGAEEEYKTILSAFSLFCRRIHDQEGGGGAKIVHFLIPRGSDYGYANANGVTIADLSLQFERIAKAWGQYFIPLSYFNGIKPNASKRWSCPTGSMFKNTNKIEFPSADGLHPNAMGMEAIADGVHRFLCSIM